MSKLVTVFKIPELRQKIFITLLFLVIYRIGFHVPLPMLNQENLNKAMCAQTGALGQVLSFVSLFSGGSFSQSTIFGLGIMPYISASIIFQLLGSVYPPLEKLQKEGESGRKKINEYTRYATVLICLFQAFIWVRTLTSGGGQYELALYYYSDWFNITVSIIALTAGSIFLMWVGEQIDEYGIGNGISLIIMAGIIVRLPAATSQLFFEQGKFRASVFQLGGEGIGFEKIVVLAVLFIAVVVAIIASSLLMIPFFVFNAIYSKFQIGWAEWIKDAFTRQGYVYNLLYIILIYFFCYFWTAITFNPKDMADNLKDYGSFIPGYRPGRRTADYLENVMLRITYVGAAFLALVAVIPSIVQSFLGVDWTIASFLGGTGLLIVISVCLDLV